MRRRILKRGEVHDIDDTDDGCVSHLPVPPVFPNVQIKYYGEGCKTKHRFWQNTVDVCDRRSWRERVVPACGIVKLPRGQSVWCLNFGLYCAYESTYQGLSERYKRRNI
jgi:hypothetical protein